jgi:hypothetical protein
MQKISCCPIEGCDGKGNIKKKHKNHRSLKSCPNNPNNALFNPNDIDMRKTENRIKFNKPGCNKDGRQDMRLKINK